MSHRTKHRWAAFARRIEHVREGKPADTSSRKPKPRQPQQHARCPNCPAVIRHEWQFRLHLILGGCQRAADRQTPEDSNA